MPFDGGNFPERRPQPQPARPSDTAVCLIIMAVAFSMLVLPISLQAFADIVKYLQRP
jgi:hypothetical protein